MECRCVQCGFRVNALYVQYSPGNIRLVKCGNCKEVADEYIECELMILLIDLILHKPKAYRHLLYNVLNHKTMNFEDWYFDNFAALVEASVWFSYSGCLSLLLRRCKEESGASLSFSFFVSTCRKVLMDVFYGNFIFLCTFVLAMRILLNTSIEVSRFRHLLIAILISSYFKILLIAMMVWEFPSSMIFIIDLFVLSSNTVALEVMTESAMNVCMGICLSAHALKFLSTQAPDFRSLRYSSL